jgi:hypothetical protein
VVACLSIATIVDLEHDLELPKSTMKKQKYELGHRFQDVWATQLP